ncbi:MAG TPA: potassium channel family protein [Chryseolinea sp.]|nr:potassium channel family protein [Chryseolinea sp.]
MNRIDNIWKNDKGFIWMLVIALLFLVGAQLTAGLIWETKILLRIFFFLFTIVAVKASSLPVKGKYIGYSISVVLLLLALATPNLENRWLIILYNIMATGYLIYIVVLIVNQIFAGGIVTLNKIIGGVAVYILLGHLWTSIYLTVYIIQPDSFLHSGGAIQDDEALKQLSYFSFITLTTVGYGDTLAVSSAARILVMMEGLLGQLFPAVFIAKLVSLQLEHSKIKKQ